MSKSTKKRNKYNTEVVNVLSEEFQVTTQFIRQAIRQDKTSLTAETIRKKYFELARPSAKAIEDFKQNPTL